MRFLGEVDPGKPIVWLDAVVGLMASLAGVIQVGALTSPVHKDTKDAKQIKSLILHTGATAQSRFSVRSLQQCANSPVQTHD